MSEDMIPIVLFVVLGTTFGLLFWFRFRARREVQLTVRAAIERGQELTPEFMDRLSDTLANPFGDLRRGAVSIALGLGFMVFAFMVDEPGARGPLTGIASLPLLVGIAYVGLWYFIRNRRDGAR